MVARSQFEETYRGTLFHSKHIHSHIITYQISFADGTKLEWNSLEDENEMQAAREIFKNKMPQNILDADNDNMIDMSPVVMKSG